MMKTTSKYILTLVAILMVTTLSAQTYNGGTWYSLYETGERTLSTIDSETLNAFTPVGTNLTFDAKRAATGQGNLKVAPIVNGQQQSDIFDQKPGKVTKKNFLGIESTVDYTDAPYSATVSNSNSNQIKFYTVTGATLNKYFKNVKLPLKKHILIADGGFGKDEESKSFGNVTIGNVSAVQTVKLRSFLTAGNITITSNNPAFRVGSSSNQGAHAFNVGTNACASTNGASGTPASGGTLGDINLYDINIYFAPTAAGEQSGTITISDGTSSATISVSGVGMKKTQTIAWAEALTGDSPTIPVGKKVQSPANAQTEITYSVKDNTIISIDGNTLTALKAGTTTITATAAETNEWLGDTSTITVKVTEKKVQYIQWNDNLTRFKVDDEPFTLTATASILIDAENEITEAAPERNQYISYQSENPAVVSVDGNTLYINGEGETILTAILQGDEEYEEAVATMPVRVRIASTTLCESYVLNAPNEAKYDAAGGGSYEPTALSGPAHQLTFEAKKQYVLAGGVGNVEIQQYVNGSWNTIAEINPGKDYQLYGPYTLNRNATNIRFYTGAGSYNRYFKNVLVSQATYLETTTSEITVAQSIIGDVIERTIAVQYSNIPEGVVIDHSSNKIQLSTTELGNACGTYGEKQITLTIIPTKVGTIEDTITIHDEATGKKLEIPVVVHTQRNTQTIIWEQNITALNTTDNITLSAEAKTPIYYTSSDSTIAYANGNHLIINKYGRVTITAVAPQDEKYEQATASKEITINAVQPAVSAWPTVEPIVYAQALTLTTDMLIGGEAEVEGYFDWNTELNQTLVPGTYDLAVRFIPTNTNYYASVDGTVSVTIVESIINDTPTFVGGTDQSWSTSTNWNLNRVPNAEDSVIINAPVEITDGAVEVLGMTINAGGAIHITPTGGLTVGEGGIVGATEDNFTIDNNTQGVGFLRINPDAKSIPTNVTINYTTRGKSGNPRDEVWQYIGAPGANMSMTNEGVLIYHWSEQNGWVKATTAMAPFVGYAISRTTTGNDTYTITTTPVLDNHTVELTRTPSGMDGSNLFVNSYLAPIDLAKFELGDIVGNVEQTFYLFNSGSWNDWQNVGGGDESIVNGTSPGQYFAITPGSAALLDASMDQTTIPPMQGVYVVANESATIHLDYNKHVFTSTSADMNRPMRAPQQQDQNFMRVRIQVNSDNSGADRMYVIQHENATKGYDNGYDAKNILADGQANIYTHEQDGQMEISVTNQLDSTYIGFAAGDDAVYTLTFTSLVGEEMYLYDIEQDILIPLAEQEQYTFYAQPNSVNNQRFILLLNPDDMVDMPGGDGVATEMENLSATSHVWFAGKTLYVADAPANTTLAIYSACGMCIMAPNVIPSAPYALDLSHLPMGVYVLRLNNQAYKFVCK